MLKIIILSLSCLFLFGCKTPEARRPISKTSGSFIDESVARNKDLFEKQKTQIISIIGTDSTYINSNNGFWYKYNTTINDENAKTPNPGDVVNYNYSVSDLKGTVIYSKEEQKKQDYIVDKEELFNGLREGLKLMKAGETVTFIFPSQKAYGYYGDTKKIGVNVPIICNVTLNSITQK